LNDALTSIGARGIEAIETTTGSGSPVTVYPLYDVHGNMVATLTKNTAGTSWSVGDERSYDVWGSVRSGATTGGPKGRYVASLGHVQDDESGLIYMRARYYEPGTGRFLSEDPGRYSTNMYVYCSNKPTTMQDQNGKNPIIAVMGVGALIGLIVGVVSAWVAFLGGMTDPQQLIAIVVSNVLAGAAAGAASTISPVLGAALSGALQPFFEDLIMGRPVNIRKMILGAIVGAVCCGAVRGMNAVLKEMGLESMIAGLSASDEQLFDAGLEAACGSFGSGFAGAVYE
jgi:RHS repeat-associated protein